MKAGPERPTLIEQLIGVKQLPYTVGCLVAAGIISFGAVPAVYLDTSNLNEAIRISLDRDIATTPPWQIGAERSLTFIGIFLIFYLVRYIRMKTVAAEPQLLPLSPRGEESFHEVFGRISSRRSPLVLALPLGVFPLLTVILRNYPPPGPFTYILLFIAGPLLFLGLSNFIWAYASAIWGLHKLGRVLRLRRFYEDRMMGVRPAGSLSLSLALSYFLGIGSFLLIASLSAPDISGPLNGSSILLLLGIAMFLLPLNSLHRRMLEEKQREQEALRGHFTQIFGVLKNAEPESQTTLGDLRRILTLEMADRKVSSIPAWPFDTQILGRFVAIILSLLIILIGRYLTLIILGI